tara:strand:- start:293 stop:1186 length:894 start_codon:yes stop_codon:yes gene_type:complete
MKNRVMNKKIKVKFPGPVKSWGRKEDPNEPGQWHRYYSTHPQYVLNLLMKGGADIEMVDATKFICRSTVSFDCLIDGHLCKFDFNDHEIIDRDEAFKYKAYFKFHYHESHGVGASKENIFPFSPVNFHDWDLYNKLQPMINYTAKGKVLNNQAPAGAAVARRNHVHQLLRNAYGNQLDAGRYPKEEFYKLINNASAIVCVPGARNNMLDRGQGQQLGFGACTISPKLNTRLSYHGMLVPGVHYVECKPDYSDLIEKVNWVRSNEDKAIKIGRAAKQLFLETSTPQKQVEWIKKCVHR